MDGTFSRNSQFDKRDHNVWIKREVILEEFLMMINLYLRLKHEKVISFSLWGNLGKYNTENRNQCQIYPDGFVDFMLMMFLKRP